MKTKEYTPWETIQKLYPDRFVLLENPVFERADIKEAIFILKILYKDTNHYEYI